LVPILALLAALLAPAGIARAEDATPSPSNATTTQPEAKPGPAEARPAESAAKPEQKRVEGLEEGDTWIDFGHSFLEDKLFRPVFRIDRFFSDQRDLEAERARSYIRWRNEVRFVEGRVTPSYTTELSANLRFPGLNRQLARLQIEVAGQTRDTYASLFPRPNPAPGEIPTPEQNVGTADAGLALRLWDTLETHADVGAGVTLALPPGQYVRLRLRFNQRPGLGIVTRQALTSFWRTEAGFGETGSADVERPISPWAVARVSATTTITELSRRFDWQGDVSLAAALRSRVGAVVGWGIAGATKQLQPVSTHRFYVRLRRDVFRRWIFLEVEPEVAYPWTADAGRQQVLAVTLRADFVFQGNEPRLFPGRVAPPVEPAGAEKPPTATSAPGPTPAPKPEPSPSPPANPEQPAPQPKDPEPKDPAPQQP
jgi:hypothetical protein